MRTILQDLRYSFRQLVKTPGFALTAIVSLALGIGATTAVFSVVYAILMDPYPYAGVDRMIHLRLVDDKSGEPRGMGLTASQWQQIRKSPVVEDAFAADGWSLTVTGADVPENVEADYFSSNAFNYFGVPAALGRNLQPSDAIDGQDPQPVVELSYKFWMRYYGGNPAVIGQTVQMVRKNYTIVGVAAPRFTWDDADVYTPLKITPDTGEELLRGRSTQARRNACAGGCCFAAAHRAVCQGNAKAFPDDSFSPARGGVQRRFPEAAWRDSIPAVWIGEPVAADRLRQRVDSAAGPRHCAPA